jgi:DNA-binding transcriptional LysR family regulator
VNGFVNRQGAAMEMHQVRYFLAVADELNFTRAADKCNVAQPSLTRAIKLLEEEFGGPLFHRERANTHLSELGQMVRPHLQQILEDSREAKRLAQDFSKLKKSKLKVGMMCTIAPNQLVELFSSLHSRYPGLELELTDASARQLDARLLEGDLEVAIYCLPGEKPDERLHVMPLFREQMMIVVHPGHPLAMRNTIRLPDLEGQPYLNRVNCEFYGCSLFEGCSAWNMVYRSERDDWILAMTASGLGFGFMPENCISHPAVVARPLVDPEYWREVNLVTIRGRPHSPALGALVREAMRVKWHGQPAISVSRAKRQAALQTHND